MSFRARSAHGRALCPRQALGRLPPPVARQRWAVGPGSGVEPSLTLPEEPSPPSWPRWGLSPRSTGRGGSPLPWGLVALHRVPGPQRHVQSPEREGPAVTSRRIQEVLPRGRPARGRCGLVNRFPWKPGRGASPRQTGPRPPLGSVGGQTACPRGGPGFQEPLCPCPPVPHPSLGPQPQPWYVSPANAQVRREPWAADNQGSPPGSTAGRYLRPGRQGLLGQLCRSPQHGAQPRVPAPSASRPGHLLCTLSIQPSPLQQWLGPSIWAAEGHPHRTHLPSKADGAAAGLSQGHVGARGSREGSPQPGLYPEPPFQHSTPTLPWPGRT